jgi:hypothetical protein
MPQHAEAAQAGIEHGDIIFFGIGHGAAPFLSILLLFYQNRQQDARVIDFFRKICYVEAIKKRRFPLWSATYL